MQILPQTIPGAHGPMQGTYPGVGNANPLWYACLENSTDRGASHGGQQKADWSTDLGNIGSRERND